MSRFTGLLAIFMLAYPVFGTAHAGGDPARGWVVAKVRCQPCHFLNQKKRKLGPGLLGVYGRAPAISGVPFARWDSRALDAWLSNPRKVKSNTTMLMPPLQARDRADVIAWLRQVSRR